VPRILGRVNELWRYPVKSLRGEQVEEARCGEQGFEWDRHWAVQGADGKLASGKSTQRFRRMPGLFSMASYVDAAGVAWVRFPSGPDLRTDDPAAARQIGKIVGEEVRLVEAAEVPHFDAESLHLVTTSSIGWLAGRRPRQNVDRRRFRPNILVDTVGQERTEDGWIGRELQIGEVRLLIERSTERCVMITMEQSELESAPGLLHELHEHTGSRFGVYGRVAQEGAIRVGDDVVLKD
jgi:uncharacterized protein YcbX